MAAQTYAFSGPNVRPYQNFTGRSRTTYIANSNGVWNNVSLLDQPDFVAAGFIPANSSDVACNLTATTDPGSTNDSSQGYSPNSTWFNTTTGRAWICVVSTVNAAQWALAVVPGVGVEPSSNLEQFGSGTGTVLAEGNIYRLVSGSGVTPTGTGVDNVLAVYSLPANSFDGIGNRGLTLTAAGAFGSDGNNKRVKIIFNPSAAVVGSTVSGGTTIADTGTVATNGGGWNLQGSIFKYGVAGSNTQIAVNNSAQAGGAVSPLLASGAITAVETAPILMCVTGNAAVSTGDIILYWFEINAMN